MSAAKSSIEMLDDFLRENDVRVVVGLRQQGHMPTVERMLAEGGSWEEIGEAIHWQPAAAERWYRLEKEAARQPNLLLRDDTPFGFRSLGLWEEPPVALGLARLGLTIASGKPLSIEARAQMGAASGVGCLLSHAAVDELSRWLQAWLERNRP